MALLEVSGLTKEFGTIQALDGVDLDIEENRVYSIIGPNGAGKSTLFNCITGFYFPTSGSVRFRGEDITGRASYSIARDGIRRVFQSTDVFDELTVLEIVNLAATNSDPKELMETLDLIEIRDEQGDSLSLYERKRVALALAMDGELLLLDEIFSGLNPTEKPKMREYIERIAEKRTVVLIEHDVETAFELADEIIVLYQGRVLGTGSPEEIKNDPEVKQKYLSEMAL
ncbi:ABC transporter ATP-binding protein [Halorientalis litorea]|jgi:ABC-type branched-subunit amino acid transport system ATPase component|uniref:ABC transporter ATP-binding protein n=1 Tax=Halorientalis litorea TaxID=2931977 RepID=UPI001FF47534|nr:ABC transporter ATP-binding protein [Halorientalis litorea]